MNFKVEMEDGTFELVANVHMPKDNPKDFRVHHWGDIWLVATLGDDVWLVDDDGKCLSMGSLRRLDAMTTTFIKTGGEPRRPRTFKNRKGVNVDARPFSKQGE